MNINELKAMSQKELCVWSSKVNAKELKAILKENGIKGYSKLKKAELLNLVLDMFITEEVKVEQVEVLDKDLEEENTSNELMINEVDDIDVKKDIEDGIKTTLSFESSFGSMFPNRPKKTKEEYIKKEIDGQKQKHEIKVKNAIEYKTLNSVANKLNNQFEILHSGLRAEVLTTRTGNYIRNNLYIFGKGVCLSCYDYDFYFTKTDTFITGDDKYEEDSWFDYTDEYGCDISQHDICKEENKLDVLYVFGCDDNRSEIHLNIELINEGLIDYRMKLMNDVNVNIDMCTNDWFDIKSESEWIDFGIEVDEFLAHKRIKRDKKTNFGYMTNKAMDDLYNKHEIALCEVNNIKLLK